MPSVVYGSAHIKSIMGILKIAEIGCLLLGLILVICKGHVKVDYVDAFLAGTIIGLIISCLILIISITTAAAALEGCLRFQYICHIMLFIYLLVVSAVLIDRTKLAADIFPSDMGVYPAAGAFGLIASFAYLADAFVCFTSYGNSLFCR